MKILLFGAAGDLGSEIAEAARERGWEVQGLTRQDFDVAEIARTQAAIQGSKADVVVNCTAFHRVEACEGQRELAFFINGQVPKLMALECMKAAKKLVHFSSDYVFDGQTLTPYVESDPCQPVNAYGESKLQGELGISAYKAQSLIFRLAGLFGSRLGTSSQKGGDFPKRVLESARNDGPLEATDDLWFSPTYAPYAAWAVTQFIEEGATGIVHLTNQKKTNWAAFAQEILKYAGIDRTVKSVSALDNEKRGLAKRPRFSVLSSHRKTGWAVPAYHSLLERYVKELA